MSFALEILIAISSKQVYNLAFNAYWNKLLPSFILLASSKRISKVISKIPNRRRCKRINPKAYFIHYNSLGSILVISDVKPPYNIKLNQYLELFRKVTSYFIQKRSYLSFLKRYEWKLIKHSSEGYIVKLRSKRRAKTTYLLLTIAPNGLLTKVRDISRGKEVANITISYYTYDDKVYPINMKIVYHSPKTHKIKEVNINLKLVRHNITEDLFIKAQGACFSLD